MECDPLVTIMTPCYNHRKYLDDYFGGLLSQTYDNIELILFDDGSTDGSWEKILSYQRSLTEKFQSVILERHDNVGPSREIEMALDRARGELVCILESDDYYLPTKIADNVRYLREHPEFGAVHSEIDYVYGERIEHRHWRRVGRRIPSGDIFEALLVDNFIMICSLCCRSDLFRTYVNLSEYASKGYIARDYAGLLDLARHTQLGYIDEPLARYRVLRNSFVHSSDLERAFEIEKNYQQIKLDYLEEYGGSDRVRYLAAEGMHEAAFLFSFRMHQVDVCRESYDWLNQNNPTRYRSLPFRILALSMRNTLLWRAIRRIESMEVFQRMVLAYFSLRNRSQASDD
jgi:glycosyltransferase involved in cell wall biosynthesis